MNITRTIRLKLFQFDHLSNPFKDHMTIIRIKFNLDNVSDKFDFKKIHEKEVKREIMNLNSKKATCHGAIPTKLLNNFATQMFP